MRDRPLADVMLDGVDADKVIDLVAIAAVLARRRADATHDRRKGIAFDHAGEGILLPGHFGIGRLIEAAGDGKPSANVVARWAAALAWWRTVHVGRALVGVVGLEDPLLQIRPVPRRLAVLVTAIGQLRGLSRGIRHGVLPYVLFVLRGKIIDRKTRPACPRPFADLKRRHEGPRAPSHYKSCYLKTFEFCNAINDAKSLNLF